MPRMRSSRGRWRRGVWEKNCGGWWWFVPRRCWLRKGSGHITAPATHSTATPPRSAGGLLPCVRGGKAAHSPSPMHKVPCGRCADHSATFMGHQAALITTQVSAAPGEPSSPPRQHLFLCLYHSISCGAWDSPGDGDSVRPREGRPDPADAGPGPAAPSAGSVARDRFLACKLGLVRTVVRTGQDAPMGLPETQLPQRHPQAGSGQHGDEPREPGLWDVLDQDRA